MNQSLSRLSKRTAAALCTLCLAVIGVIGCDGSGAQEAVRAEESRVAESENTARQGNQPPLIRYVEFSPSAPMVGSVVTLEVDAFDPDGESLRYAYQWELDGILTGDDGASAILKGAERGQLLEVTVIVSDGDAETRETIAAEVANAPPVVDKVIIQRSAGKALIGVPYAQDADHDSLTFSFRWSINGDYGRNEGGELLPLDCCQPGDEVVVEVVADDGEDSSVVKRSSVYVISNAPPLITSRPDEMEIIEGKSIRYQVQAEDPEGQTLRYLLEEGPEGMELDVVLGELAWKPHTEQVGEFAVRIVVDDRHGGLARQEFTVTAAHESRRSRSCTASGCY